MTDTATPNTQHPTPNADPHEQAAPTVIERRSNPLVPFAIIALVVAMGLRFGWSLPLVIGSIAVMIFMHELGHFVTAKLTGMKATEFFLGFGPRLWSFKRGETEYGLKAIPGGAYVKIVGMNNLDETDPVDEPRTYRQQTYPRKLLVASAGSAMHFLMALGLVFVQLAFIGNPVDAKWYVRSIAAGTSADVAGLEPRDHLLAVNGQSVDVNDLGTVLAPLGGQRVTLTVERDGNTFDVSTVLSERLTAAGAAGFDGLVAGDRVESVDGTTVDTYDQLLAALPTGQTKTVKVLAASGQELEVNVTAVAPVAAADAVQGFLGIGIGRDRESVGVASAVAQSFGELRSITWSALTGIKSFFSPGGISTFVRDSFNTTPGQSDSTAPVNGSAGRVAAEHRNDDRILSIVGATRLSKEATDEDGALGLIAFMATFNVFVGVFNLVPFPPFDGGHIAVATYERIRSRRGKKYHADYSKVLPIIYVVLAIFISLSLLALYRDIIDPVSIKG